MSELKVYKMVNEYYCDDAFCVLPSDVYLKSEADEVIEALNRQIKFLQVTNSSKCYQCNKCADGIGKVFDETLYELKEQNKYIIAHTTDVINSQEVEIRRQKYKRCLAIARWCFTKSNYHFVVGRSEGGKTGMTHYRISRLYSKWYKRWLKLAEKFKYEKKEAK